MTYYGLFGCQYLFSTYNEYKKKKQIIIDKFLKYSLDRKYLYKLYIYSRPLLTNEEKDKIWNELYKKSELFETLEEYKGKRLIIAKAYATWNKKQIVMYRSYVFSKDINKERLKEMWEEINEYSSLVNGSRYESSS